MTTTTETILRKNYSALIEAVHAMETIGDYVHEDALVRIRYMRNVARDALETELRSQDDNK